MIQKIELELDIHCAVCCAPLDCKITSGKIAVKPCETCKLVEKREKEAAQDGE